MRSVKATDQMLIERRDWLSAGCSALADAEDSSVLLTVIALP
jgi:hypothetical protein